MRRPIIPVTIPGAGGTGEGLVPRPEEVGIKLRRLGNRIARYSDTTLRKLLAGFAGFVLDAIPVAAFAFTGSAALAATNAGVIASIMTADLMSVLTIALGTCAMVRLFTRPRRPSLRLLPVGDAVARNLNRRFYWLIGVMATAYALTETLPLIGMLLVGLMIGLKLKSAITREPARPE